MKNRSLLVAARLVGLAAQALLLAVLARRMEKVELGSLLTALALTQILSSAAEYGFTTSAQRWFSQKSSAGDVRDALTRITWISTAAGLAVMLTAGVVTQLRTTHFVALSAWFVFGRLQVVPAARAAALGCVGRLAAADVLYRLLPIGALVVLPLSPLAGLFIGALVGGLFALFVLRNPEQEEGGTGLRTARSLLREATPFGVLSVSSVIHGRNDTLILFSSGHRSDIPAYGAAYRLFDAAVGVASGAFATVIGDLSRAVDRRAWVQRALRFAFASSVLLTVGVWFVAPSAIDMLLGGARNDLAVSCAKILAPAAGLGLLNGLLARLALFLGLDRAMLRFGLGLTFANVVVNVFLLPRGGVRVAALTTTCFEAAGVAAIATVLWRNRADFDSGTKAVLNSTSEKADGMSGHSVPGRALAIDTP